MPLTQAPQPHLPPVPVRAFSDPPNLGTFVYPNTPLPLPVTPTLPPYSSGLVTPPPTYSFTILVPSLHLLSSIPKLLPIWGSQGRPAADFSEGMAGYTDDSDVRLMVLHANYVTLDEMRRHKIERKDLSVHLLWRGVKTKFRGTLGSIEGGSIQSASWGTSHDGGALEIAKTEWLPKGYAHSRHIPNRKARMLQYTNERARLNLLPPSPNGVSSPETPLSALPSNRSDTASSTSRSSDVTAVELDMEEGEGEGGKLSVLLDFGVSSDEPTASFVYDPDLLRAAVFPPPSGSTTIARPKKRRRLDPSETLKSPSPEDSTERPRPRSIVLIGDVTYILQPNHATSDVSHSRPTCTLRRIEAAKSHTPVEETDGESILGTELDQEDLEFSPAGFRFRRRRSVAGDGAPGIMSPMCRVQRWRYVFDERTPPSKAT
ncbi:hypothetical protein BS47DRAFT_1190440 [Hydnum rufescens UP504]|uniref:Uncharacterized protein n=1 Tax=Hydnum rufescens UP504 TaxID=1448309 RepID=A0A9P6ASQ5_9AGAM|nr:hypothetical protein BS47DRAFT_1190440 [Hydnum rufescens UP504]